MSRYLIDTTALAAFLQGREAVVSLVIPWMIRRREAATSVLVYAEVIEHLKRSPAFDAERKQLRRLLRKVHPLSLTFPILERYADIRRSLRPPHGPGLIGDIDTLIAATALEHGLTVVTTDGDFSRVNGLEVMVLDRRHLTPLN